MDNWTKYLPLNGSRMNKPSLPDGSLALDSRIEANGLGANSLFGNFSSVIGIGQSVIGGGYVRIDSANKRIIINDGLTDRVLIGFQQDGF